MELKELENKFSKTIAIFKEELSQIQAQKVSATMLKNVFVVYENGAKKSVIEISAIRNIGALTLAIKPYESSDTSLIEKALTKHLNLNPSKKDDEIYAIFPPLSEERRKELAKMILTYSNNAKQSIRNVRQDYIKANPTNSKEEEKKQKDSIQKILDKFNNEIDDITKNKQQELMKA